MGCRRLREKYLTFNLQPFCMTVPLKKHIVYDFLVIQLSMCRYWNAKLNEYVYIYTLVLYILIPINTYIYILNLNYIIIIIKKKQRTIYTIYTVYIYILSIYICFIYCVYIYICRWWPIRFWLILPVNSLQVSFSNCEYHILHTHPLLFHRCFLTGCKQDMANLICIMKSFR